MKLDSLNSGAAIALLGYFAANSGGLAINAASAATFKTVATINYSLDGVLYSKAAFAAQAFPASTYAVKQGYSTFFVVTLDAAGNVGVAQGAPFALETDSADGLTKSRGYRVLPSNLPGGASTIEKTGALVANNSKFIPDIPAGQVPIGIIKVVATGADFVPGTTALDAAGITATYFNITRLLETNPATIGKETGR
jgi:hypothetical protein